MGVKVYDRPLLPVPMKWVVLGIILALAVAAAGFFFLTKDDETPAEAPATLEQVPPPTSLLGPPLPQAA